MRKAFTLAEILITLTIIGIIAAITIPAVTQEIQDQQFKVAWENDYSALSQAVKRLSLDNGGTMQSICATYYHDCLQDKLLNYLNYTKKCLSKDSGGQTYNICWHGHSFWGQKTTFKFLNEKDADTISIDHLPLGHGSTGSVLTNGSLLLISYEDSDCKGSNTDYFGAPLNVCGWVDVDVNGFKGPNVIGRDIFGLWVLKNSVLPIGSSDYYLNTCNSSGAGVSGTGFGCSAKYLMQ